MLRAVMVSAAMAVALCGCGPGQTQTAQGPGAEAGPAAVAPKKAAGGSLFSIGMSQDIKAIRAGLKDDKGVLPIETLARQGVSDRIETAGKAEPQAVFKIYQELKADGSCNTRPSSLGDEVSLEGGGRMPVMRDPSRVCDFLLAQSAQAGLPDANFERGLQDIVSSDEMYRKNARYFERDIELMLQRAQKHLTIAQQSTTPGIADKARTTLAAFEGQQFSRGYGGEQADMMRAQFLGLMAIAWIQEESKYAAVRQENCRSAQFGAAMALKALPNC